MPETTIDCMVEGGKASAGPPLGPALGPAGVNVGAVIAEINSKTKGFAGMQVPVKVIVNSSTKEFRIEVGSPPVSALIKKELGLEKGTKNAKTEKIADMPIQLAIMIAQSKMDSMLARDLRRATKEVIGSCVPLGITIDDKDPRLAQKELDEGVYDDYILGKRELAFDRAKIEEKKKVYAAAIDAKRKAEEAAKAAAEAAKAAAAAAAGAPAAGAAAPAAGAAAPAAGAAPAAAGKTEAKPAAGAKPEAAKEEKKGKK
jgi:large subunit ribosomal protein L11